MSTFLILDYTPTLLVYISHETFTQFAGISSTTFYLSLQTTRSYMHLPRITQSMYAHAHLIFKVLEGRYHIPFWIRTFIPF
jgi:hypothetical protein